MGIKNNIALLDAEVRAAGARLVVVGKTQPPEKIQEAYDAGQRLFGENKVQEMTDKHAVLPRDISWHMIGHLQTNKVRYIAGFVSLIHSVDSLRILEEIDKQGHKAGRTIDCLLQVHIAREQTKFGLDENELWSLVEHPLTAAMKHIRITGLMGMASFTDNDEQVRKEFRALRKLFERLRSGVLAANVAMNELSMGMSSDYKIALQEGSTIVRVGTMVFGQRM